MLLGGQRCFPPPAPASSLVLAPGLVFWLPARLPAPPGPGVVGAGRPFPLAGGHEIRVCPETRKAGPKTSESHQQVPAFLPTSPSFRGPALLPPPHSRAGNGGFGQSPSVVPTTPSSSEEENSFQSPPAALLGPSCRDTDWLSLGPLLNWERRLTGGPFPNDQCRFLEPGVPATMVTDFLILPSAEAPSSSTLFLSILVSSQHQGMNSSCDWGPVP